VSKTKHKTAPVEGMIDATDFVELKRDMQSAKVIAWLQYNQQQLIAAGIVVVLALVGYALWQEQQQSQKESAALMYIQASNTANDDERFALLDSVIKSYPDSGYAILAYLQKSAAQDVETRKAALQALMNHKGAPEFVWQAKLDLAELYFTEGDITKAKALLESRLGKHYEQARFAMLANMTTDMNEKIEWIQKALAAESHDHDLQARLEAELARLKASR